MPSLVYCLVLFYLTEVLSISPAHHRLHHLRDGTESTQFFNASHITMLSGDCAAALASPVHCSPLVRRAAGYSAVQYPLSTDNLTTLCTQTCASSLDDLRSKVEEACSDEIYTDKPLNATGYVYGTGTQNDIYNVEGISVKPVAFIDYYLLGYKLLCMQEECACPFPYASSGGSN